MGGGGDHYTHTVSLPPSSFASSIRFLGLLKQPEPDTKPNKPFEFDERDVIWPSSDDLTFDADSDPDPDPEPEPEARGYLRPGFGLSAVFAAEDRGLAVRRQVRPVKMAKSAPVNVPGWHVRRLVDHVMEEVEEEKDEEEDDEEEMVPPHVIVARSHVTTFSVFEGVGRTLKGRDLRRVRNAVFQQTGFLD